MPSRLSTYSAFPWTGGLVTAVDPALVGAALTKADNLIFTTQATKQKREGINYDYDDLDIISLGRSSSGTTRTLVMNSEYRWTVGETIIVSGAGDSSYNVSTATAITAVSHLAPTAVTLTASNNRVTWSSHGLSAGNAVVFTALSGGGGLSVGTVYYVLTVVDSNNFTVATASGGSVVDITTDGTGYAYSHLSGGASVTFTASNDRVGWTAHGFSVDQPVVFGSLSGSNGITAGTTYFVKTVVDADNFLLSATPTGGGSAPTTVNISSDSTGTGYQYLANVISYTASGSLSEGTTADTAITVTPVSSVIALSDYWYGTTETKTQRLAGLGAFGRLVLYNAGARTNITDAGTAWTVTGGLTRASMVTFDNRLLVAVPGSGNKIKHYMPTALSGSGALEDISNTSGFSATPTASILQTHLGRVWCNDKTNPDRLHFSETGAYNVWQGAGDSGALDIGVGDGDPDGITAIFPSFKGQLFVAKRTKLYRIAGYTPETWTVEKISDSIGCVGQQAVAAVEQDDIYFVSERGVHSLTATDKFGGFEAAYKSAPIQKSVKETWSRSQQRRIQAAYIPTLNSVAFGVAENSTNLNSVWLYNVPLDAWYRWPSVSCESLCMVQDSDKQRLYLGGNRARIAKTFSGDHYDTSLSGTTSGIALDVQSGLIFVDGSPHTIKAAKKLSLVYVAAGTHTIGTRIKIDNFSEQSSSVSGGGGADLLGVDFILGSSVLGTSSTARTETIDIDGYGRGFRVRFTNSNINEQCEILGFQIMYEAPQASLQQEYRTGDDA